MQLAPIFIFISDFMRYLIIKSIILTITVCANSQVNLVQNPSFEDLSSCPSAYGQINKATYWDVLATGGGGTPDLYSNCCTQPIACGVPNNISNSSFQFPHEGYNYVGISCYGSGSNTSEFREYIQFMFSYNLIINRTYCIKFFVNLSNHSTASINTIGAYFDDGSILTLTSHRIAFADSLQTLISPQFFNATNLLDDTLNWMLVEGSFTASGSENYLTIGNFMPDSLSNVFLYNPGPTGSYHAYYYIDDVSVIDISTPADAGEDVTIIAGDSIYLGRRSEIGLDEACVWFLNGMPIDTVAGIMVAPDSITTYILQQTICGNVQYDTVTVTVDTSTATAFTHFPKQEIKVFPNPTNGELFFSSGAATEIIIFSIDGRLLHREESPGSNGKQKIEFLFEKGLYIVLLKTEDGLLSEKVVVY
jgi:hypothetical protein